MSGKFLAGCVEPQVVGPEVPHYKIEPWETFGCLEDLRLESSVIKDQTGLLNKEVDVGELKFFEPSLPLPLNLLHAIDLEYLFVGFLLDQVCKVEVFDGFDQVFEAEIAEPLELEGVIHQSLIMLSMSEGDLANIDGFLQHILLD